MKLDCENRSDGDGWKRVGTGENLGEVKEVRVVTGKENRISTL